MNPGAPTAFAEAILELSRNEDLRERLTQNAQRVGRELFDRDKLAEEMREILHLAAGG